MSGGQLFIGQNVQRTIYRGGKISCDTSSDGFASCHRQTFRTHAEARETICIGFTTPRVSCSQYGNRMPAHNSLNCVMEAGLRR